MESKKWWESKTLWTNVLSIVAIYGQVNYGFIFSPEMQMGILALINIGLRTVTNKNIAW